jgi:hypothetical protein
MRLRRRRSVIPVLDKVGQEIKPGCVIAYGHNLGRCAAIRIGRVIGIKIKDSHRYNGTLFKKYKIAVQSIDDDSNCHSPRLMKQSIVQFPDRAIVLDPSVLPVNYRSLLGV